MRDWILNVGRRTRGIVAVAALVAAVATPAVAESPLDFFRNQTRRAEPERAAPAPRETQRGGFFSRLFEFRRPSAPRQRPTAPSPAPQMARAHEGFQRVICRRTCDGEEFALGIQPKSDSNDDARAMCTAAGAGMATELVVQDFVSGAGFTPVSAGSPVAQGRASADPDQPSPQAGVCQLQTAAAPFMVPLLHDATLRRGDIVATQQGFKVFVGRGNPPYKESDFLDNDERRLPKDIRDLEIAVR